MLCGTQKELKRNSGDVSRPVKRRENGGEWGKKTLQILASQPLKGFENPEDYGIVEVRVTWA